MRETEYRAWIKPLNKWADEVTMQFTSFGFPALIEASMQGVEPFNGDDIILEQLTGLKDKDGVEIWEGDIVLCDNRFQKVESIGFEDGGFTWGGCSLYDLIDGVDTNGLPAGNEAKVIGNIHMNWNLLDG